jgi:hypothetical protein
VAGKRGGRGFVQFYLPWAVEYVIVILVFAELVLGGRLELVLLMREYHDSKMGIENMAHGGARGMYQ